MEKTESPSSLSVPSIEKDLGGNRFSLEYLSSITGEEVTGFVHVPSTVCVQAAKQFGNAR